MNWRGNTEMLERLAAEYVLGTLRGRARQRFEAWMHQDAALRRTVVEWEERLSPMAEAIPPVRPSRRVWRAIDARVGALPARAGMRPAPRPPNRAWESLAFWRNWSLATTGLAAALALAMVFYVPRVMQSEVDRTARDVAAELGRRMQPSYIAVLEDAKGNVTFVAYAARTSDELWVKNLALDALGSGKRYELWGLPARDGAAPRSLGLVPVSEKGTLKLAAAADKALGDFPKLAISLEPASGSPTGSPTGPVMYVGNCHKFW